MTPSVRRASLPWVRETDRKRKSVKLSVWRVNNDSQFVCLLAPVIFLLSYYNNTFHIIVFICSGKFIYIHGMNSKL